MDSFEFSKIAGAVLAALLLAVGPGVILDALRPSHGEQVGYRLPTETAGEAAPDAKGTADAAAPAAGGPAAEGGSFDPKAVVALIANAKPDDGAAAFKKCAACHVVKKDAASAAAPNLWGVVNRPKAAQADFEAKYSDALKGKGGEWSYENLAAFLHKPKDYVPGTKMVFAGIADAGEIANIIAYLRTLADSPAALPQ